MIFNVYAEQKEQVDGIGMVSCGHIFAQSGREINRPKGRSDWLLFFVAKESETFYLHETITAEAGSFILFAPGEKQHHMYTGTRTAEFYYIHFTCDGLPRDFGLNTSQIYKTKSIRQVCDIFEEIIEETLQKKHCYEKYCIYRLLSLLTMMERDTIYETHPEKINFEQIASVVHHMNKHYDSNYKLADYANMCALSKYHFLRVFEKIIGTTPLEYRNNIRLEHAVDMLDEQLSVEETSRILGYSSASYFSSAFKQKYGVSPKQYQKQK